MPLYEEFHFRKKHLTYQDVVDRAEARRNQRSQEMD